MKELAQTYRRCLPCDASDNPSASFAYGSPSNSSTTVMQMYAFVSLRGFHLSALQFPFPLVWRVERGSIRISARANVNAIAAGRSTRVRTEELFDVDVLPDRSGAAVGHLEIALPLPASLVEPDWSHLASCLASSTRGGFGLALTQSMFRLPRYPWNVRTVARELGLDARILQMVLFRESYSFHAALQRCRRLTSLLNGHDSLFRFDNPAFAG